MKKLNEHLYESLLDDEDELVNDDGVILIEQFLKDNYIINGTYNVENGVVNINGSIKISWDVQSDITELTNGLFEFGTINGDFIINDCSNLKSLKGGPREVKRDFLCCYCKNLESFEYSPKNVDGCFEANYCVNITSLKGLPKRVKSLSLSRCDGLTDLEYISDADEYILDNCKNLKSLKGLPSNHEYSLNISNCKKIKSLKGCNKKIGYLDIIKCSLNDFNGGPEYLSGNLYMNYAKIKSLEGFPKRIDGDLRARSVNLPITIEQFKLKFIPQNVKLFGNIII